MAAGLDGSLSLPVGADRVKSAVESFAGGGEPEDDVMLLRRRPQA